MRALVVCAHGTDNPDGQAVVNEIVAAVAARLREVEVRAAYVDVQQPRVGDVVKELAAQSDSVIVVPLLLSYGYHVEVDVTAAVEPFGHARQTGSLGPDPLLADILVDRLRQAAAADGDAVVLAVAGSSRSGAASDADTMRGLLQDRWKGPVSVGFCSAMQPSVSAAVSAARAIGARRVAVAAYLVGPGVFQNIVERSGADLTTAPLGADERMAALVIRRYQDSVTSTGA